MNSSRPSPVRGTDSVTEQRNVSSDLSTGAL